MIYRKSTLPYFINLLCKDYCNKTAITWKTKYRKEKIKYKTLLNFSKKFTAYLLENGFKKGNKILIMGPNCPQWVITFFGTLSVGMILIPIDYNSNINFVQKIIEQTNPNLFVLSRDLEKKLDNKVDITKIIFFDELFSRINKCNEALIEKFNFYISGTDTAEIIFTSGTTDEPKGVVLTHRNIGANINSCSMKIMINSGTKLLSILPLSHMFEQIAGLFVPLRQGGQIVYLNSSKPLTIRETLLSEEINAMIVVPAFLETFRNLIMLNVEKMNKLEQFKKVLVKSDKIIFFLRRIIFSSILKKLGGKIKFIVSGGAHLNIEVEKFWNRIGIKVLQGYGLTETSPIISTTTFNNHELGSVGTVLPNQYISLDKDGEIKTCGENVFHGYLNKENLNEQIFENGWFKTGDIGEFDDKGNLFIKGRKKNIIVNPAGMNIYPEDIENKLKEFNVINDCIIIPNTDGNFYLTGYFISDNEISKEEINNILNEINSSLSSHQKLKELRLWFESDFPRTPTKKIIRREVEKIILNQNNQKIDLDKNKILIKKNNDMDIIIEIISEISGCKINELNGKSKLIEDIGMDSIHKLELLTKIEAQFLVNIEEEKFYIIETVNDILNLIIESKKKNGIDEDETTVSKSRFNFINLILRTCLFSIFRFFSFFFFRIKTLDNKELYNIDENFIIVANHSSHLDSISILRSLPSFIRRKTFVAAASDYFFENKNFLWRFLLFILNIFPFYRKEMMRKNLYNLGMILNHNRNIILFPEGTRSRNGDIQQFKNGIGMIVKSLSIPCLPVKIENAFNLLPYNKKIPKQGTIIVKYGKLIRFSEKLSFEEISNELYSIIKET